MSTELSIIQLTAQQQHLQYRDGLLEETQAQPVAPKRTNR